MPPMPTAPLESVMLKLIPMVIDSPLKPSHMAMEATTTMPPMPTAPLESVMLKLMPMVIDSPLKPSHMAMEATTVKPLASITRDKSEVRCSSYPRPTAPAPSHVSFHLFSWLQACLMPMRNFYDIHIFEQIKFT